MAAISMDNGHLDSPLRRQIALAAAQLRKAEQASEPCPPIRDLFPGESDEGTAYRVQAENTALALAAGRRLVAGRSDVCSTQFPLPESKSQRIYL